MEKKKITELSKNAKVIKVIGQADCMSDCVRRKKISGKTYPIPAIPVCWEERCTYETIRDAHWSVDN